MEISNMSTFKYHIEKIAEILHAQRVIQAPMMNISYLSVDTRSLPMPEQTLFVALAGRRNGHEFIDEAYLMGVRNFLVRTDFRTSHLWEDANFLKVPDTLDALQLLVQKHRTLFDTPVIGITGSNGKTIVKEWLWQLLSNDFLIVKSPKSYNSQIGVPLSVWSMGTKHQLAIFEAGISQKGEMQHLQQIIQPTLGVFTHIGEAHAEGFVSKWQKIEEKLILFKDVKHLVFSPDNLADFPLEFLPPCEKTTWSFTQKADLQVISVHILGAKAEVQVLSNEEIVAIEVPFTDKASLDNMMACWAVLKVMGYSAEQIIHKISFLQPVPMRLELKTGIHHCSVIDDSYSADESSLHIALDFLDQQNQHPKKTVILSDITQSDKTDEELYQAIAVLLHNKKIDRFIGVGSKLMEFQSLFHTLPETFFFQDTASLIKNLTPLNIDNESILIKGARKFTFEKISKLLTQKVHDTVLEVHLNALVHNLNAYKSLLSPKVKIMAMVKAFSYGSGSFEVANVLQYHKIDYLAVAYADEGVALRQAGITLPIMVMSPELSSFDSLITYHLEPEIYSLGVLHEFLQALPEDVTHFPIHLKLDTGMHRLGFIASELPQLLAQLNGNKKVKISSVFSHLAASDDAVFDTFTASQIANFQQMAATIEQHVGYQVIKHICNTAAIGRFPQAHFDMVRLGIGLYGFDAGMSDKLESLQAVASLKTTVTQIKHITATESVGYGRKGVLANGGKIATVKIGYADGYSRAFGNGNGVMLINGQLAYTVGNICMDMCMLDVSHIETFEGDEAIIFNDELTVQEIAKLIHTIPYEILTNVSQRVKRVYYYN